MQNRIGYLLVCVAVAVLALPQLSMAQGGLNYDQYKVQLAQYEKRSAETGSALADCKSAGEALSKQIADADGEIASVNQETYTLVGSDEAGVKNYIGSLDQTEAQLMGLMNLSDSDLFDKRDEFDELSEMVKEMKENKISLLPAAEAKLRNIEQLLERIDSRMPAKRIKNYTVMRNDSLWKIAKKPDIYDNPYLWPRIYVENRSTIKDPDLIYPASVLKVPFGVDRGQHLVLQGHSLSAIATQVYKDASQWSKIYQANKSQILDPNLVFPAQVLDVPAN
jgi:nucleoid-associated protein YgaU